MRGLISVLLVLCCSSLYLRKCLSSRVSAIYAFGDSLVDNGNNNFLSVDLVAKANYTPYGIDYPGSVPTGRVSNGRNIPDFIADFLRLPHPTTEKNISAPISLRGYNYGSAGGGILEDTGPTNALDLSEQVSLFEITKETKLRPAFEDETRLAHHLANSIFFIWVGNNDYILNYFGANSESMKQYTPEQFADLLALRLSEQIQELYGLGARKIVVFEVAPIGCIPASLTASGGCNEIRNSNVTLFNGKLANTLQTLSSQLPNSYISLGKNYDLTIDAVNNPANYGFTNVTGTCCELRSFLGLPFLQCKLNGGRYCPDRDEYLFWDAAHPTEAGYRFLSEKCITDSSVCTPYSIRDLAHLTVSPSSLISSA